MPFVRFALPMAVPRKWDLIVLCGLIAALGLEALGGGAPLTPHLRLDPSQVRSEPWRLLSWIFVQGGPYQALGNAAGLCVGLTMTTRCSGRIVAWSGLLGSALLPGLWALRSLGDAEVLGSAACALYGALGMGVMAWATLRHELTYTHRRDLIAGFGTLGVVAFALSMPLVLENPVRGIHAIAFVWGALLVGLAPRSWDATTTL